MVGYLYGGVVYTHAELTRLSCVNRAGTVALISGCTVLELELSSIGLSRACKKIWLRVFQAFGFCSAGPAPLG